MKQNSSIIFRRPTPIKPAWLYYIIELLIRWSVTLVTVVALCYLIPGWRESLIMLIIGGLIADIIGTILRSTDNIKIYTDGSVHYNYRWWDYYRGGIPRRFTVQDINQIEISPYKHWSYTFRRALIELENGKRADVIIEDDMSFRNFCNELLKHNPNINIIE